MLRLRLCCLAEATCLSKTLLLIGLVADLSTRPEVSAWLIILLDDAELTGSSTSCRECEIEVLLLVIVKFWWLEIWYGLSQQNANSSQENF